MVKLFVDAVVGSADRPVVVAESVYWCLEPNDYRAPAAVRESVSRRLDRVLCWVPVDRSLIGWVTDEGLTSAGLSLNAATGFGWANLDGELARTQLHVEKIDGVAVGLIESEFPSKASLLLAPGLRGVVEADLGWPLLAVAPDRDFVCLWNARHPDLVERLAGIVAGEHRSAPYPLSMEVFEIDGTLRAIGEYSLS